MKHAGEAALAKFGPLLAELRKLDGLREPRPGCFYRKASAFLHFHEDPAGMFADIRGEEAWIRLPVNTQAEKRNLVRLAAKTLRHRNS